MKNINKTFKNIQTSIIALLFIAVTAMTVAVVVPDTTHAAGVTCSKARGFLTFPPWYRGLNVSDTDCAIKSPASGELSAFIWTIVLNIIDIALQLVGYIAVIFILYGGFQFMTSQGNAQNAAKARTTILNAVIGLVIAIAAVAIVNLILGVIK